MTETAQGMTDSIRGWTTDQMTGEANSVTAVAGAPSAARTIKSRIHNPTSSEARQGARSSVSLSIEVDDDQEQLHEWLRSYKDARQEFQDLHVERARQFRSASPAMGIIAARQVLEIPYRGQTNMMFMANGGVWLSDVAEAFGKKYDSNATHKLHGSVFSVPEKVRKEMRAIIEKSRGAIASSAIQSWQEGVDGYQEIGDGHATGMSYAELGKAFVGESVERRADALRASSRAVSAMIEVLDAYPLHPPVDNIVEVDEVTHHLTYAVKSVVALDDRRASDAVDVDALKRAVYRLDDYGINRASILSAYKYLAARTPFGKGKLFFMREADGVGTGIETAKLLDTHRVIIGNLRFRKDNRRKRP